MVMVMVMGLTTKGNVTCHVTLGDPRVKLDSGGGRCKPTDATLQLI